MALLVSILLPVFNAAETLPLCLRSIARQSESGFECIIVDDGKNVLMLAQTPCSLAQFHRRDGYQKYRLSLKHH